MKDAIVQPRPRKCGATRMSILRGEDVGIYGGAYGASKGLLENSAKNVIDTPISEAAIVGPRWERHCEDCATIRRVCTSILCRFVWIN